MPSNLPRFTVRTSQENIDKLAFIAAQECRTTTKEMEYLIVQKIEQYEKEHGEIAV